MNSRDALARATGLAEAAAELTQIPWDQLVGSDAVVVAEAITSARSLLDASLLRVTDRLETTDAVTELGWASVKDYLTHLTGGHKGAGGGLVRAVEQLRDLPAVQTALEDGRVTLPQARVIAAQVAKLPRQVPEFRTQVADALLVEIAEHGYDASVLQGSVFDKTVRALDPGGRIIDLDKQRPRRERGAHQSRYLSFTPDHLGGIKVQGYGTPEDVERIKTTLLPLTAPVVSEPGACGGHQRQPGEPMFDADGNSVQTPCLDPGCRHDGRDPRDHGARMWDALVEACDRLQAHNTLPRDHGNLPRVMVTIDYDNLHTQVIAAGLAVPVPGTDHADPVLTPTDPTNIGTTPTGATLSAHAVRRLACDADIIPVLLGTQSQVLDVGRTQRLVTPGMWTALQARDQHCAFPSCTRMPLACDAHHIVHWADGGPTNLNNMVMLCRHHHTVIHQTPWAVTINPDTGQPVWHPPPQLTITSMKGRMSYRPGPHDQPRQAA